MPRLLLAASLTVALLGFGACGDESAAKRTKEALARLAFDALEADDFAPLRPAVPTAEDVRWMLDVLRKEAPEEAERPAELIAEAGGAEALAAEGLETAERAFEAARAASAPEVDWEEATFVGVDEEASASVVERGLETAQILFRVASRDAEPEFLLLRCIRTEDGWKVAGGLHYRGVEREAEPFHGVRPGAHRRMAEAQMANIDAAIRMYRLAHDRLPERLALLVEPDEETKEAYLESLPGDPWGNAYVYERLEGGKFRLVSAGPDGSLETADDLVRPRPVESDEGE